MRLPPYRQESDRRYRSWPHKGGLRNQGYTALPTPMAVITKPRLNTLFAASIGAVLVLALGLPLPLLLGPMFGCLVAGVAGARLQGMEVVSTFMRTFLGVAIGASITPELISELPRHAPSLLLIPLLVAVIGGIGYPLFRRVYGFDHPTAYFAAMPGGLQDMLVFGQEAGGDMRAMSLIHATRVLLIVTVAPFFLTLIYGLDFTAPPGEPITDLPVVQIALMLVVALVGWQVAKLMGMFGASIIGPMAVTAAMSLSGLLTHRPPAELIWAAQFFIGIAVGATYTGITAAEIRRDIGAGLLFSVMMGVVCLVFILSVLQIAPASELEVILAFLPGGQAEMTVLALVAGADVALVVAHHLLRIVVIVLFAPAFAAWLQR